MEGHAMVRTGGIRVGTVAVAVMVASCGTPAPHGTASPTPHSTPPPRPSAAAGPCASVMTTTPITQVPAACAALWAPYGVTKVPPANLTDATPTTPQVVNATQGAVSDAQLAQWILASNRDSLWYRWAEANDQAKLLPHLASMSLYPVAELRALAANEAVMQPDCALFPTKVTLFPLSKADQQFFTSQGESVADPYVFVSSYPGPCTVTALTQSGQTITIASYATPGVTFFASHVVSDDVLGPLLFADGAGNCSDHSAPTTWCQA
jgi:hypothetical protein